MLGKGCTNSGPSGHGVPEMTLMDGPGFSLLLSVGIQTQWGRGGTVKEGLELTLMCPFNVEQGGLNSGPDSRGVPEWM